MHKFLLVAKHEYLTMVRRRSFVLATIGVPLLIALVILTGLFLSLDRDVDDRPLGYVDQAGVVVDPEAGQAGFPVPLLAFADEAMARQHLDTGVIQAYYVIPADYRQSHRVTMAFSAEPPAGSLRGAFDQFLRLNLAASYSPQVQQRALAGIDLTVRSADGQREFGEGRALELILPFAAGFFFIYAVLASTGYLLQAVTMEKENRTVELMATSLSPLQLIAGKALGLMGVAFTQLAVWVGAGLLGLLLVVAIWDPLGSVEMPWTLLLVLGLYFLPTYALMAGIMIAIGSVVTETQQGQQMAGILNLFFVLPFFFAVLVFSDPNSPILVVLTLLPTTSFLTVAMRWGVTSIPAWQLILSYVLLLASAGLSLWVASRVFRAGMLRYGQRLSLQAVLASLRG